MNNKATIVVDLGFGDAGKGSVVDYLTQTNNVSAIVRFNGGAQAAHNVALPDGRCHTFSQFGSGMFVPGVSTYLSRFVLVDPFALQNEAMHLENLGVQNPLARLFVDEAAIIVSPFQKAANRIRETMRGDGRHGSTGMGIGETMADNIAFPNLAIYACDLRNPEILEQKFCAIQEIKNEEFKKDFEFLENSPYVQDELQVLMSVDAPRYFAYKFWQSGMRMHIVSQSYLKRLAFQGDLIFEGAQGVLLDEWHGFHPYTTWSTATFNNAIEILNDIGYTEEITRIGVVRAYQTRHGAGPFPTEDAGLTFKLPDFHNGYGLWQGGFRVGWFDAVLTRYAVSVCGGVDSLFITNMDRLNDMRRVKVAVEYEMKTNKIDMSQIKAIEIGKNKTANTLNIKSFKVKEVLEDLAYQENLTGILYQSNPVYSKVLTDTFVYLRRLEQEVGVPVDFVSFGPKYTDKIKINKKIMQVA